MTDATPEGSRKYLYWTVVNVLVVLCSTNLFIDILYAEDDRSERPGAMAEYLLYNFGTSMIWVVEVSLEAYEQSQQNTHLSGARKFLAEWIVALYFVGDSLNLLFEWKIRKVTDLSENSFEALVGILFYSYLSVSTYNAYKTSKTRFDYERVSEDSPTADV